MVSSSSSFSFSPTSSISFDDVSVEPAPPSIKFLCSYGGKILPRRSDGKLSYVGGHNRVLAVHRGVSFSELQAKLRELCGWNTVSLRCQLPTEDMDTLVSVTCDEDLANLVQEYYGIDGRDRTVKIRAFAFHPQVPAIKTTPDTPLLSGARRISGACVERCVNHSTAAARFYGRYEQLDASAAAGEVYLNQFHGRRHGTTRNQCDYLVHHGDFGNNYPTHEWWLLADEEQFKNQG